MGYDNSYTYYYKLCVLYISKYFLLQRKPPVYATGIPLPQLLIPEGDLKRPITRPTTKLPVSVINHHLSNNIVKKEIKDKDINKINLSPTKISIVDKNNNGPIPGSGNPIKFPESPNNVFNNDIQGEVDKEHNVDFNKLNSFHNNNKGVVNLPTVSPNSQTPKIPLVLNTTPKVQNTSYRPPTTFNVANPSPQPENVGPLKVNVKQQNNKNQPVNWSTTTRPNVSYGTRRTPPLVSPGFQTRPTKRPIQNNNVQNNFYEDIVTGRPGARPGFAPKPASDRNVFDVTVSADQNYGSNNNANQHPELFNRYPSGKKSKKKYFLNFCNIYFT